MQEDLTVKDLKDILDDYDDTCISLKFLNIGVS